MNTQKTRISAVIPIKNEENRILRQHLENVSDFCDEIIIILDEGTTDNSYLICIEFTDKIYYHKFTGISSNEDDPLFAGIKYVTNDWFLILEADFILSALLKEEIRQNIELDQHVAFEIGCCNFMFGKYFTNQEHWHFHFHLFRKGRFEANRTDLHSRNYKFDGTTEKLLNPVFHYGVPDIQYFINNLNIYTSMDAPNLAVSGKGGAFSRIFNDFDHQKLVDENNNVIQTHLTELNYSNEGHFGEIYSTIMGFYLYIEAAKVYEFRFKKSINWVYGDLSGLEQLAKEISGGIISQNKKSGYSQKNKARHRIRKKIVSISKELLPPVLTRLITKLY